MEKIILTNLLQMSQPTVLSPPKEWNGNTTGADAAGLEEGDYYFSGEVNLLSGVSEQLRESLYHSILIKDKFKLPFNM